LAPETGDLIALGLATRFKDFLNSQLLLKQRHASSGHRKLGSSKEGSRMQAEKELDEVLSKQERRGVVEGFKLGVYRRKMNGRHWTGQGEEVFALLGFPCLMLLNGTYRTDA